MKHVINKNGLSRFKCLSIFFLWIFILFSHCFPVQISACDINLLKASENNNALTYQVRKNDKRCEGFYNETVSAPTVYVVGATFGRFRYDLDINTVIHISSPFIANQPVKVRAVGIALKTYYRMDTELNDGKTLKWPVVDVLYAAKLTDKMIGIYGWTGSEGNKTFLPLFTSTNNNKDHGLETVYFKFCISVPVQNVVSRIFLAQGEKGSFIQDWTGTEKKKFHAGEPVLIKIPADSLGTAEIYIKAILEDTGKKIDQKFKVLIKR